MQTMRFNAARESNAHAIDFAPAKKLVSARMMPVSPLGDFVAPAFLLILSMAFLFNWEEIFFLDSIVVYNDIGFSKHQVYFASKGLTLLAFFFFNSKRRALKPSRTLLLMVVALLLASTSCFATFAYTQSMHPALIFFGSVIGGVGFGLLFLLWFGQCSHVSPLLVLASFLIARIISASIAAFCNSLDQADVMLAGFLMAALTALLSYGAFRLLPTSSRPDGEHFEGSPALLWRLAVFMGIQRFTFAFREASMVKQIFSLGSNTSFVYLFVAAIILTCIVLCWNKMTFTVLVKFALPVSAVAFLVLPLHSPATATLSNAAASTFCAIADVTTIIVLAALCNRKKIPASHAFGLAFGTAYLCVALGESLFLALDALNVSATSFDVAFGIIATIAIALLVVSLPDKSLIDKWFRSLGADTEMSNPQSMDASSKDRSLLVDEGCCHSLAKQHGLTPREEEIMELLAKGKTSDEIGDELYISKETIRTHRRHIYSKCGVHSEEELMLLLEGIRQSVAFKDA